MVVATNRGVIRKLRHLPALFEGLLDRMTWVAEPLLGGPEVDRRRRLAGRSREDG